MQFLLEGFDDYLFHLHDQLLKELKKNQDYQEVMRKVEQLEEKYPLLKQIFSGENVTCSCELSFEVREAIKQYVEMRMDMQDCLDIKYYLRGHRDCFLYLMKCGIMEGG